MSRTVLLILFSEREMEKVRSQSEETSQNKIRRIQEKMQNEINLAEQNETEMQRKFSEARTKTNQVTEELIAEKHKSNLLAVELNEKEQRLHKLMTERFFKKSRELVWNIFQGTRI